VVWVNATNLFDAACGFGGYRESGYGREGGREGMYEYLEPAWLHAPKKHAEKPAKAEESHAHPNGDAAQFIDRTVKQYIGGKQARPDSGYSFPVHTADGSLIGEAPLGNRKDIRNAVEAAHKAEKWAKTPAHTRAQILYYIAENLSERRKEVAERLAQVVDNEQATQEVELSIERCFTYAAWADKFDGSVHNPPMRNVTLAMNEAIGVIGIVCPDDAPLLAFFSLVMPAIAAGNTVVAVPSERYATVIGDLYQVFDTSDLPGGVVNIVAGRPAELAKTLAEHDDVDAIWCFRDAADAAMVKAASIGNLKQVWTNDRHDFDWFKANPQDSSYAMRHAVQVKNIWVPYGE